MSCKDITAIDMFGSQVSFTFEKNSTYTTKLGAIISIFCIALMGAFLVVRTKKLVSQDDPFFAETTLVHDWERINLLDHEFMFAVEKPDPKIGIVSVFGVRWD